MTEEIFSSNLSRRNFLKSTAAFALVPSALAAQSSALTTKSGKLLAYAGTYTSAVDGSANGEGIYLFEVDPHTGRLSDARLVAKIPNPSWIVVHPSKKYLYAINEVNNHDGGSGSLTAFSIDSATGDLTVLNTVSSAGAGPAHMSLDAQGNMLPWRITGGSTPSCPSMKTAHSARRWMSIATVAIWVQTRDRRTAR